MARTITQSLNCSLNSLSHEKRLELIDQLRDLLFEHECSALTEQAQLDPQNRIVFCAECGSVHVNKHGRRGGHQRWRCADCGKSFTDSGPRSMIDASKLPRATWMKFIECFVDDLSIKKCALKCKVSTHTAYYMRMRVLKLISDSRTPWTLRKGETAQLDETFVYESFKGNRTKCEGFEMPRPAFVRGRAHDKGYLKNQGKSKADHICIATGVSGDDRSTFLEMAGRAMFTSAEAKRILDPKIEKESKVLTDELPSYVGVLSALGAHHVRFNSHRNSGELNGVNALHSHFKDFLKRRHGVSTRRLSLYLAEFAWRWENGIAQAPTRETAQDIVRQIAVTDFTTMLAEYKTSEYPYLDWWDSEEGQKELVRRELAKMQRNIDLSREEAAGDPELERVVDERQATLDEKISEAKVNVRNGKRSKKKHNAPTKPIPQLTLSMLRTKRE